MSPVLLHWTTTNVPRLNLIHDSNLIPRHPLSHGRVQANPFIIINQYVADGDLQATTYLTFHYIKYLLILLAGLGTLRPFLDQHNEVVKHLDIPYRNVATLMVRLVLHDLFH